MFAEVPSPAARRLHRSHEIAYVLAELGADHMSASAAIPLLFPPVRIESAGPARGWYVDGGTRLNAPIKPALDLGADRLVVVATDSIAGPVLEAGADDADEPPDFAAGLGHLLEGVLVDPLIKDMRLLGAINAFHTRPGQEALQLYRTVRDKPPYRRIPYVFVGPEARGRIGELASERFAARYGGVKGLRDPDLALLSRLLRRREPGPRRAAQPPVLRARVRGGADRARARGRRGAGSASRTRTARGRSGRSRRSCGRGSGRRADRPVLPFGASGGPPRTSTTGTEEGGGG